MAELHLVRDLLDKLVVDRNGREMGRADGIVMELRKDAPPRVAAIELGPSVLFARVAPVLGRWAGGIQYALGVRDGQPLRIDYGDVLGIDRHVRVNLPEEQ